MVPNFLFSVGKASCFTIARTSHTGFVGRGAPTDSKVDFKKRISNGALYAKRGQVPINSMNALTPSFLETPVCFNFFISIPLTRKAVGSITH